MKKTYILNNLLLVIIACFTIGCSAQDDINKTQLKPSNPTRATYETCIITSQNANAKLPQRLDSHTTTNTTSCRKEGNEIVFVYQIQIDLLKSELPPNLDKDAATDTKNTLCTNPAMKPLLQFVDMRYDYYDAKSEFVFSNIIRIQDCGG